MPLQYQWGAGPPARQCWVAFWRFVPRAARGPRWCSQIGDGRLNLGCLVAWYSSGRMSTPRLLSAPGLADQTEILMRAVPRGRAHRGGVIHFSSWWWGRCRIGVFASLKGRVERGDPSQPYKG